MSRKNAVIGLVLCGAVTFASSAAAPQEHRRPNQRVDGVCDLGTVEERLNCLSETVGKQRSQILVLQWQLKELREPRIIPLTNDERPSSH